MKKLISVLLIIALAITTISAQENLEIKAYGGLGVEMYSASGFKDVRISDYRRYGASEGSLLLPLNDMNGAGALIALQFGADIGFQWAISFKSALTAGENVTLDTTANDYYQPTAGYPPVATTIDPKVSLTGFKANIHVLYKF